MAGTFNLDTLKFECDYANNSILCKNEYVQSCTEFGPNRLCIFADLSQYLLIVHDWKVIHEIAEPDPGNTEKFWQIPLPGFHMLDFPFLISSGKESYNLINVKDGKMYKMIKGSAYNSKAQPPAHVIDKGAKGFQVHFATRVLNNDNFYE